MAQNISTRRDSAVAAVAVTPSDSTVIQQTRGLYIGTSGGDLSVVHPFNPDGSTNSIAAVVYKNAPVGYHPLQVVMVKSTGTGVSDIVAIY